MKSKCLSKRTFIKKWCGKAVLTRKRKDFDLPMNFSINLNLPSLDEYKKLWGTPTVENEVKIWR